MSSRRLRRVDFETEGQRGTEFLNSGISPFDSLVYARNRDQALKRAMRNGDTQAGTFLSKQRDDLTFTTEQAQAAVDLLPAAQQITLYKEQVDRMNERATQGTIPPEELAGFNADRVHYQERLLNLLVGGLAIEAQAFSHTPDAA